MGPNRTSTVQLPPGARAAAHPLLIAKAVGLVPPKVMLVSVRATGPALVSVTGDHALFVPTVWLGNGIVAGLTPRAVPVPFMGNCSIGFTGSELVIEPMPLLAPLAVGVNVMLAVQTPNGGKDEPQVPGASKKSEGFVPPIAVLTISSGASPRFERMTD